MAIFDFQIDINLLITFLVKSTIVLAYQCVLKILFR